MAVQVTMYTYMFACYINIDLSHYQCDIQNQFLSTSWDAMDNHITVLAKIKSIDQGIRIGWKDKCGYI